jgi:hypothetical protein
MLESRVVRRTRDESAVMLREVTGSARVGEVSD